MNILVKTFRSLVLDSVLCLRCLSFFFLMTRNLIKCLPVWLDSDYLTFVLKISIDLHSLLTRN